MQLFRDKYLVIDYGSTHIKGALMESGPGGGRVLRLESLPIVDLSQELAEEGPEAAQEIQEEELGEYEYNLIRYVQSFFPEELNFVLNLPLERLYVRDIRAPAVSQKQMAEVIPFEVEGLLPVSLEEAAVIGQPWETGAEESQVITFTARHETLASAVAPLMRGNSSLRMLSVDAAGLAGFLGLLPAEDTRDRVIGQIDVGGRYTIFNAVRDGKLVYSRQIPIGGRHVTEAVAEVLGLEFEQAEEKKRDLELNLLYDESLGEMSEAFFKRKRIDRKQYNAALAAVREVYEEIADEINRSLLAVPCEDPAMLYISGGGSLLEGSAEFMSDLLERTVQRYPTRLSNGENAALWATVLGTAEHYRLAERERLDFLNSAYGQSLRGGRFNLGVFATPILILSGAAILFLLSLLVGVFNDSQLNDRYRRIVVQEAERIPGLKVQEGQGVKDIVNEARRMCEQRLQAASGALERGRFLGLLTELTNRIQRDTPFTFSRMTYKGDTVEIVGEIRDYDDASRLETSLQASEAFSEVNVDTNQLGGQKLQATIKITLRRSEGGSALSCP